MVRLILFALLLLIAPNQGTWADSQPRTSPTSDTPPAKPDEGTQPTLPPSAPPERLIAPEFKLLDLRGNTVESDYGSRPVTVVHFWATWCVPCMREIPEMNRIASTYEPSGAALFAVALSSGSAGDLRQLERAYDIRHRVLVGEERLATDFGGVPSFPTTYVVDGKGRIVERHVGATPDIRKKIERSIRQLLEAPVPPRPRP